MSVRGGLWIETDDDRPHPADDAAEQTQPNGRLDDVRAKAAALLGASSVDEIALTPSTTVGLSTVIDGLVASGFIQKGDEVGGTIIIVIHHNHHPRSLWGWIQKEGGGERDKTRQCRRPPMPCSQKAPE
jgi:selenocysteine lyase/cysteine desulfurase